MKRGEKGGEGPAEKQDNLGEKLRKVGKRGGHTTPIIPFWRLQQQQLLHLNHHSQSKTGGGGGGGGAQGSSGSKIEQVRLLETNPEGFPLVSARKLAAALWELHHYKLPLSKMQQGAGVPPPRLRRLQGHRHNHQQFYKDKGVSEFRDPSSVFADMPDSAGSLRRHVAASLMQHHRALERSNHAIQPVSPASYGSSMEMAPYNPVDTPTSSTDFKGRAGETSYSLKTSTELLKVLNRIWSLEEQHASNIALVKALKKELDYARARIKELVRDQQADQLERDELMKQVAEDKLIRRSKEQDRINAAIQSVRDELEDERKLRKRSESLHRKLARELYEVKTSLADAVKKLEIERKSRELLENLCDKFAWGIRDYEQEVHALRQKLDRDWAERGHNRLILHLSEAWIDESAQMKLEPQPGLNERNSVLDRLSSEIQTFLNSEQEIDNLVERHSYRRNSLESIPLNMAVSAPKDDGDEDDSAGSDSHCFELGKPSAVDLQSPDIGGGEYRLGEKVRQNLSNKQTASQERTKNRSPASLQVKFEEKMAEAISHNESKVQTECPEQESIGKAYAVESSISKKSEVHEAAENGSERKNMTDGTSGVNSSYLIDSLLKSHYLLSEGGNMPPENDCSLSHGNSMWRSHPSPVRQWTEKLPSHDLDISESSSKLPPDLKENTLKAKLLEARTRGQRSRSRLKTSKISL